MKSTAEVPPPISKRAAAIAAFLGRPPGKAHSLQERTIIWSSLNVEPAKVATYIHQNLRTRATPWIPRYPVCGIDALIVLLENNHLIERKMGIWKVCQPDGKLTPFRLPSPQDRCNALLKALRARAVNGVCDLAMPITPSLANALIQSGFYWAEALRLPAVDQVAESASLRASLEALVNRRLVTTRQSVRDGHLLLFPSTTGSF